MQGPRCPQDCTAQPGQNVASWRCEGGSTALTACVPTCAPGFAQCGALACDTNLTNDEDNCGACNRPVAPRGDRCEAQFSRCGANPQCGPSQVCSPAQEGLGEPVCCGAGLTNCGGTCVDTRTDAAACVCTATACAPNVCGDGVRSATEACDDGNDDDTDGCLSTCEVARCGDGKVQAGVEACDDGNAINTDACTNVCQLARCGDGFRQGTEACDDGNLTGTDACTEECKVAVCGDGRIWAGEEACDDGNAENTDACLDTCVANTCGDGFVFAGVEPCDDGNQSNADACLNTCLEARCGDGFTRAGVEQCDDANQSNLDACTNVCQSARCGDGFTQGTEQCDDAATDNTGACLVSCVRATCGDGFVQAGIEVCDDNNLVSTDGCTQTCNLARCGDGYVQAGVEQCDNAQGNNDGAACRSNCRLATCGDGFVQVGVEQCDDANSNDEDACRISCNSQRCGDGSFSASEGEQCDDGNGADGDGCSSMCKLPELRSAVSAQAVGAAVLLPRDDAGLRYRSLTTSLPSVVVAVVPPVRDVVALSCSGNAVRAVVLNADGTLTTATNGLTVSSCGTADDKAVGVPGADSVVWIRGDTLVLKASGNGASTTLANPATLTGVLHAASSLRGVRAVTASSSALTLRNLSNLAQPVSIAAQSGTVAVAMDPLEQYVVAVADGALRVFRISSQTGNFLLPASAALNVSNLLDVAIEPVGRVVYGITTSPSQLRAWRVGDNGTLTDTGFTVNLGAVPSMVQVSPNGDQLLVGFVAGQEVQAFTLNRVTGQPTLAARLHSESPQRRMALQSGNRWTEQDVALLVGKDVNANAARLGISLGQLGAPSTYQVATGDVVRVLRHPSRSEALWLTRAPDGSHFATLGTQTGTTLSFGTPVTMLADAAGPLPVGVNDVAVGVQGTTAYVALANNTVVALQWNVGALGTRSTITTFCTGITALAVHPVNNQLAASCGDRVVRVYNGSGMVISTASLAQPLRRMHFSADGTALHGVSANTFGSSATVYSMPVRAGVLGQVTTVVLGNGQLGTGGGDLSLDLDGTYALATLTNGYSGRAVLLARDPLNGTVTVSQNLNVLPGSINLLQSLAGVLNPSGTAAYLYSASLDQVFPCAINAGMLTCNNGTGATSLASDPVDGAVLTRLQ